MTTGVSPIAKMYRFLPQAAALWATLLLSVCIGSTILSAAETQTNASTAAGQGAGVEGRGNDLLKPNRKMAELVQLLDKRQARQVAAQAEAARAMEAEAARAQEAEAARAMEAEAAKAQEAEAARAMEAEAARTQEAEAVRAMEAEAASAMVAESGLQPPTEAVPENLPGEAASTAVASVPVERAPASAEEERVYAFTDWLIDRFPGRKSGLPFSLETDRGYTLTPTGSGYAVLLSPFILHLDEKTRIDISPLQLHVAEPGENRLQVTFNLPATIPLFENDTAVVTFGIGSQEIVGIWETAPQLFSRFVLRGGDLSVAAVGGSERLEVSALAIDQLISRDDQGSWEERYEGSLAGLSIDFGETYPGRFSIEQIGSRYTVQGSNFQRHAEIRELFSTLIDSGEELSVAELEKYAVALDAYLQLLQSMEASFSMANLQLTGGGETVNLASLALSTNLMRDPVSAALVATSGVEVDGLLVATGNSAEQPPAEFSLKKLAYTGDSTIKAVPPDLFTGFLGRLQVASEQGEGAEEATMVEGVDFVKEILSLIDSAAGVVTMNGLRFADAGIGTVDLDTFRLGGGFDTGSGEGGVVRAFFSSSGLNSLEPLPYALPQAVNFDAQLTNIPSLLKLFPDPGQVASGGMDMLKSQVMMNGMEALAANALTFSLLDSFVAFPASRFSFAGSATVNPEAQFFTVADFSLALENADDLLRIAREYGADPDALKFLVTLIALSDRKEENGTLVDRLEARIDQDGKVFINAKDITPLLLPDQP